MIRCVYVLLFLSFQAFASDKPNILFMIADDWSAPHAGALGDRTVKTPTFDFLADNGINFSNAFVTAPSCSPCRAAILSGQHHWRLNGAANLGGAIKADVPLFTDILKANGYEVAKLGKGHWPATHRFRKETPLPKHKHFKKFLNERDKNKPFFFWFGGEDPHRHYDKGSGVRSGIIAAKIDLPMGWPDSPEIRSDICDYYFEVKRFDKLCGDHIELLKKHNLLDNTLIIMTSDNGMPFPRAKATLYDLGTKVPLAIYWKGKVIGNRTLSDFVSLHDLTPTFLELAGVKVPETMNGKSIKNLLFSSDSGRVDASRDFVLTGMEGHVEFNPQRAIRTDDFLLIRYDYKGKWPVAKSDYNYNIDPSPSKSFVMDKRHEASVANFYKLAFGARAKWELFDLKKDPGQVKNVAENPEYKAVLEELKTRLNKELLKSGDPRESGNGELFERERRATGEWNRKNKK